MTTKMIHYRRFEAIDRAWPGETFQSLVTKSLQAVGARGRSFGVDFDARIFTYPGDGSFSWLIHNLATTADSSFGTLCLYSPGIWAAVIRREDQPASDDAGDGETLEQALAALEIAERPPSAGEDFLRGVAYWLIIKDHFFVIQHVSLQTRAFEQYFQQLFAATGVSPQGEKFALISVFDKAVVGGDLEEIQAVEIGGVVPRGPLSAVATLPARAPAGSSTSPPASDGSDTQHSIGTKKASSFEKAIEVLKTILGEPNAAKIMQSMPAEAELEVDVRFGYRTQKRGVSRAALASIADAARNLPDGEVRAIGKGGKQVGDDLRLSMPMPVKLVRDKSSLVELDNARDQMLKVYGRFVEDGKIAP